MIETRDERPNVVTEEVLRGFLAGGYSLELVCTQTAEKRHCRVALNWALPHFVWRNYPETGKFRRDSCEFAAPLVARGRSFGSKRRAK